MTSEPSGSTGRCLCPACGGDTSTLIMSVGAAESAQHFVPRHQDPERHDRLVDHVVGLWGADTCEIRECAACGLGFAWPFVAGDAEFFNLAFPSIGYPRMKWDFSRTLDALEGTETSGKTALEVGAGFGFFLDLVCGRFFKRSDIASIEYNTTSVEALRSKGYTVVPSDLRSTCFDKHRSGFDYVFMFQVLEHMDGIEAIFRRLAFLLRPGGSAFITVPNVARIRFQESSGSLKDMPPNHIARWTTDAFRAVASRAGLTVSAAELEPFAPWEFLRTDILYAHYRSSQGASTLSARVRRLPRGRTRTALEALAVGLLVPSRLGAWSRAFAARSSLGSSLWVRLDAPHGR